MTRPVADDGRVTLLLVDDEPSNVVALSSVLRLPEYELVVATSGEEALGQVLRRDPWVILLDVTLPGMDGFETARIIRERELSRHVPILFMTASVEEMTHVFRRFPEGHVDYLRKPTDADELRGKVALFVDVARIRHRALDAPASSSITDDARAFVAHELRTPLVPLRVTVDDLASALERAPSIETMRDVLSVGLRRIERAVTRLEHAVSAVLVTIETGHPPPASDGSPDEGSAESSVAEETLGRRASDADGSKPILIVDDDAEIRAALRDALEHSGYSVVLAANGKDALERLATMGVPAAILVDVMMPVMGGVDFLAALDERPALARVPVLMMSASEGAPDVRTTRPFAFMAKPVRVVALCDRLSELARVDEVPLGAERTT